MIVQYDRYRPSYIHILRINIHNIFIRKRRPVKQRKYDTSSTMSRSQGEALSLAGWKRLD